jgi:hypothetical protein
VSTEQPLHPSDEAHRALDAATPNPCRKREGPTTTEVTMTDSDQPLPAPVHHDRFGWDWYPDPTGRHPYRALEDGAWTDLVSSKPGGHYKPDHAGGQLARDEYAELGLRYAARGVALPDEDTAIRTEVEAETQDVVGLLLEFAGWVAVAVSIVAGIVLVGQGSGGNSTTPVALGWLVAFGGVLLSLLLVAAGRTVRYLRATAFLLGGAAEGAPGRP